MPTTKQKPVDIETADSNVQTWLEDLKYALEKTHAGKYNLIKLIGNRKIEGTHSQIPEIYYIKIYDSRFDMSGDGTPSAVRSYDRFNWSGMREPIVSVEIKFELKESVHSLGLYNVNYKITGRNISKRNGTTKTTKPRVAIREIVNSFQPIEFYKIVRDMVDIGDSVVSQYSRSLKDKFTKDIPCTDEVVQTLCEEIMALGEDVKFTTDLFRNVAKNALPNYKKYVKYYKCNYNHHVVLKICGRYTDGSANGSELYTLATLENCDTSRFRSHSIKEDTFQLKVFSCTEDMSDIVQSSMSLLLMKGESHEESENVTSAIVHGIGSFIKIGDTELYVLTERLA
tara:strand:+ start:204 stop:1226 length:1023 start_codon:yes stop_codon:yes gene_type:complete